MRVYLQQHDCDSYHDVRFKIDENRLAMITSEWGEIVETLKIKENDICVFHLTARLWPLS
jgi:hypothetical protein